MNKDQAKLILQSSPPGRADCSDPLLAEARALLERDAELQAWFQEECALDSALRIKFQETTVPPHLFDQICGQIQPKVIRFRFRPTLLAMAAALILSAILVAFFAGRSSPDNPADLTAFREEMGAFLTEFPALDLETDRISEIQTWIGEKPWLAAVNIPKNLERFPSIGCREINWRGTKAALLCFMVDGEAIHLFVLPAQSIESDRADQSAATEQVGAIALRTWREGPNLYLAATKGTKEFLLKHVRS